MLGVSQEDVENNNSFEEDDEVIETTASSEAIEVPKIPDIQDLRIRGYGSP